MNSQNATYYFYRTPFGSITLGSNGKLVTRVALGEVKLDGLFRPSVITNTAATELLEYFAGKRRIFSVPYQLSGSNFQKRVFRVIEQIPYGQTRTPKEVAQALGEPNSFQAVSRAANSNPLPVIVPAHRIVPANGKEATQNKHSELRAAMRELEARNS